MFLKFVRMNAGWLAALAAAELAAFALLEGGVLCAMAFVRQPDSGVAVAGVLLPVMMVFVLAISGFYKVVSLFEDAVRFGRTRRRALALTAGLLAAGCVLTMGLAAVLTAAERYLFLPLWPKLAGFSGWQWAADSLPEGAAAPAGILPIHRFELEFWWYPLLAAAALAFSLAAGAVFQRFGARGGWALWAAWMAACFGPQLFGGEAFFIGSWNASLTAALALALTAGLIWAVWSLLHAVIQN